MRRGIARQISGVHSVGAVESHKVGHRCWNKSAAARHFHVDIRVGDNCASERVYNLAVNARIVIALFFNDLE